MQRWVCSLTLQEVVGSLGATIEELKMHYYTVLVVVQAGNIKFYRGGLMLRVR